MSLIKTVGFIRRDLENFRSFCIQHFPTENMKNSRFAFGCTHKWFGYSVILTNPPKIKLGHRDNQIIQLGDFLLPGWHSALLRHYRPGGFVKPHCDHRAFEPLVVSVNLGSAVFRVGDQFRNLEDGEVICFDSSFEHELFPVQSDRWSLTFRHLKPQFLQSLFL